MLTKTVAPMLQQACTVKRVHKDIYNTWTLEIALPPGERCEFAPGQFNMLYAFGIGEIPISISGDPTDPEVLIHTIRTVGPVSDALCRLKPGDPIGVRGPYGTHWPVEKAEGTDVVICAGGVGLPPLRPALYYILANREKYGRVVLLYGARTKEDLVFWKELERWRGRFDLQVEVTVDAGSGGWRGHVGTVTTLIPRARFDAHHAIAMVCGPEIMMRFTIQELERHGLTDDQIYISMERNMKCGVGLCGHCQLGPLFMCKDGPVFRFSDIKELFGKREV